MKNIKKLNDKLILKIIQKNLILHTFGVHPQYQRKGITNKVLNFAEKYAKENDIKAIRCDVVTENSPAIAMYEKFG
jgi:ribosomal protein S18 acetylase RimI-like enzyme